MESHAVVFEHLALLEFIRIVDEINDVYIIGTGFWKKKERERQTDKQTSGGMNEEWNKERKKNSE